MNLLADESIESAIVAKLRLDGHSVIYISELSPSITDDQVLEEANKNNAILITSDKDFGDLVFRQRKVHAGVVLIRLDGCNLAAKAQEVSEAVRNHASELPGAFAVLTPGQMRIRRPSP